MRTLLLGFTLVLLAAATPAPGATVSIVSSGFSFLPDSPTIAQGDTVIFSLSSIHNAVEVDQATWDANGTASNGGFSVPFGGGTVVFTTPGTYYYVCQNHVLMGMKGIITVTAAPPPPPPPQPGAVTVESIVDADGSLATAADRIAKAWSLKLYKDSVGSGIVVDSAVAGTSITADSLVAGTYVAVEGDSAGWSHLARTVNGVPQAGGASNQVSFTLAAGESVRVAFYQYIPHAIISSGFTFVPESLVVNAGDTVHFVLDPMHTAREVSQATWSANDTVSNGGFDLPSGGGSAVLTDLGTHYYVCVPHAPIGMKGRIFVVTGFSLQVSEGWNLLSLPVRPADSSVAALFPGASSKAFSYNGSYVEETQLAVGRGYWLKFPVTTPVALAGSAVASDTVGAQGGWNIIGALTSPVATQGIVPLGTSLTSQVFGFSSGLGYFIADTLEPGSGYWVKLSQAGQLALAATPALPVPRAGADARSRPPGSPAAAGDLLFRDRSGAARHLTVLASPGDASGYELPPPAPAGILDVRFAGDLSAVRPAPGSRLRVPIAVTSAVPPVTLSWDLRGISGVTLELAERELALEGTGTIAIGRPDRLALGIAGAAGAPRPAAYALEQNYPNPFNPTTRIRYDLPEDAHVTLKVYDMLGREVTTLAEGLREAGSNSVDWDAGSLSGGVYYVRLEAQSASGAAQRFTGVRAAVVLK